jgi:hypothetical protein
VDWTNNEMPKLLYKDKNDYTDVSVVMIACNSSNGEICKPEAEIDEFLKTTTIFLDTISTITNARNNGKLESHPFQQVQKTLDEYQMNANKYSKVIMYAIPV